MHFSEIRRKDNIDIYIIKIFIVNFSIYDHHQIMEVGAALP
jgi:hypothetical protein